MVLIADDFGAWLIAALADAGRKRLTTLALGADQERALRQAATAAVQLTARDLRAESDEQAQELVMVVSQVFTEPISDAPLAGHATLLEGLRVGIAGQLAVLDDASLTGIGSSSAEVLGIENRVLAEKLTGHLIQEIGIRASRGGPLFPLASLLSHNVTQLQGQRLEGLVGQLAEGLQEVLVRLDRPRQQPRAQPEKVYVQYTLTLHGQLEFDAAVWADTVSHEREQMVEEAVAERLDNDFNLYGGQGIAECVDGGELEFTATTEAEIEAQFDTEAIEIARRLYAGIGDFDAWPDGLARPSVTDSYVTAHDGVEYVVLRHDRNTVAVYDIAGGEYQALASWPPAIETR